MSDGVNTNGRNSPDKLGYGLDTRGNSPTGRSSSVGGGAGHTDGADDYTSLGPGFWEQRTHKGMIQVKSLGYGGEEDWLTLRPAGAGDGASSPSCAKSESSGVNSPALPPRDEPSKMPGWPDDQELDYLSARLNEALNKRDTNDTGRDTSSAIGGITNPSTNKDQGPETFIRAPSLCAPVNMPGRIKRWEEESQQLSIHELKDPISPLSADQWKAAWEEAIWGDGMSYPWTGADSPDLKDLISKNDSELRTQYERLSTKVEKSDLISGLKSHLTYDEIENLLGLKRGAISQMLSQPSSDFKPDSNVKNGQDQTPSRGASGSDHTAASIQRGGA